MYIVYSEICYTEKWKKFYCKEDAMNYAKKLMEDPDFRKDWDSVKIYKTEELFSSFWED